jgi:hypothetical protein
VSLVVGVGVTWRELVLSAVCCKCECDVDACAVCRDDRTRIRVTCVGRACSEPYGNGVC